MAKKEKIRLKAAQAEDRFGDPEGPPTEWRDVTAMAVVPRNSSEHEQRGSIIISGFMIVVKSSVAVDALDSVEVRGQVHQIEGEIGDYGRRKIFYTKKVK